MAFNNIDRLLVGILLIIITTLSLIINLDYFLLSIIFLLISFEIYNLKIIKNSLLFFIILISSLFLIFNQFFLIEYIFLFQIILIGGNIFYNKYKFHFFIISIYLFTIILFYIASLDRFVLYLIIFVSFFNDTLAYIFGKFIGGPLIVPKISPKKTWSGTLLSTILTTSLLCYFKFNIFFSIIVAVSFFIGDIYFSYMKRVLNIKDFSLLLKGHGGILDRLDSMFIVSIIFHIYLTY